MLMFWYNNLCFYFHVVLLQHLLLLHGTVYVVPLTVRMHKCWQSVWNVSFHNADSLYRKVDRLERTQRRYLIVQSVWSDYAVKISHFFSDEAMKTTAPGAIEVLLNLLDLDLIARVKAFDAVDRLVESGLRILLVKSGFSSYYDWLMQKM